MRAPLRSRALAAVTILGAAVTVSLPWLQVKPNRIAEGTFRFVLADPGWGIVLVVVLLLPLVPLLLKRGGEAERTAWAVSLAAPVLAAFAAGSVAAGLAPLDTPARVSLSWAFWSLLLLGAAGALVWGESVPKLWRRVGVVTALLAVAAGLWLGCFQSLSLLREYQAQAETFWAETRNHVTLSGIAVLVGTVLGLLAGWGASRLKTLRRVFFFFLNLVQTLPSLALFGFLIIPLSALGWGGIGPTPALIVLSLYAAFPIARSTVTALDNLDPAVLDAGRGIGMARGQLFLRVQVPLALPAVVQGVRTASVQAVGNTVVAALIGAGGLGSLIFFGLGQFAPDLILLGTLPALLLALGVDQFWNLVAYLTKGGKP